MLLDLVEVAKSHSGENLAEAFEKVLKDFGITEKVRIFLANTIKIGLMQNLTTTRGVTRL